MILEHEIIEQVEAAKVEAERKLEAKRAAAKKAEDDRERKEAERRHAATYALRVVRVSRDRYDLVADALVRTLGGQSRGWPAPATTVLFDRGHQQLLISATESDHARLKAVIAGLEHPVAIRRRR